MKILFTCQHDIYNEYIMKRRNKNMNKRQFLIFSIILALVMFPLPKDVSAGAPTQSQLNQLKGINQLIVVTTNHSKSRTAVVSLYEKRNGVWKKTVSNVNGVVGKNGISGNKKEGDGKTPKGIFSLGRSFGTSPKPSNVKMMYTKTNSYYYWIDDVKSKDYNMMKYYRADPTKKWASFERLTHPLYSHAIVINYNTIPIIKGKGSAIFLHTKYEKTLYTAGCVAISKSNLVKIMQKLDPKLKPHILISESSYVSRVINDYMKK